jgi:prepilin signal peptidase PulO-like enzyme (type II secretory pathway)
MSLEISYALVAGLFGLLFGSAINAIVWRLYVSRSWVKGRSECSVCGHTLAPRDLVPVVSWLLLWGRCRYCGKPITDPPTVELATAVVFALSGYALAATGRVDIVTVGFWAVMLVMLLVLAVYDKRWMILPDKVVLPLIVIAFGRCLVLAVLAHSPRLLAGYLAAAVVAGGMFYAIVFFSKGRAMGGGDIKLAFVMGLILGPQSTGVALLLAFNVAALFGIALIVARRRSRSDQIPFGPFLVGGTIVAFLYGQSIVDWYLKLNGLS